MEHSDLFRSDRGCAVCMYYRDWKREMVHIYERKAKSRLVGKRSYRFCQALHFEIRRNSLESYSCWSQK